MTAPRARRGSASPLALVIVGVAAIVVLVWGVARITSRNDAASPGDLAEDPGVAHVHGLGINPADGSLIVATHFGSFRIAPGSGEAGRIGGSYQDTMGFTVAGPDHFLGSGHPDVAGINAGQPGRLGLIESTDAGATWTSLSLSGEADFHGLALAHGQVYGWDSGTGRFMVSGDRENWETRSTVGLLSFAVDPGSADHIVGATLDELIESSDGGRSWRSVDEPGAVAVSWDLDAGLWGADAGGAVWRRTDAGWEQAGSLEGDPQAFLATADALYAAVADRAGATGIYSSTDHGRTWELRYRDSGT